MNTLRRNTYPKEEKLKRKKIIERLFTEGHTVTKYPLRLVYLPIQDAEQQLQTGISVSKRYFKHAVDRNYFKRVLRECYRHNKYILIDGLKEPYAIMFFYQTKDRLSYEEINEKTVALFEKMVQRVNVE